MSEKMDTAYVIAWSYSDGSAYDVVAALPCQEKAGQLIEILRKADSGLRNYKMFAVPTLAGLFS